MDSNFNFARMLVIQSVTCHAVSHAWQMLDGFVQSKNELPESVSKALTSIQLACTSGLDLAKIMIRA